MIEQWKAKLRAWLIGIVREAIRVERTITPFPAPPAKSFPGVSKEAWDATENKPASKPTTATVSEISFEQMEANAIKSQEKYYEPERL